MIFTPFLLAVIPHLPSPNSPGETNGPLIEVGHKLVKGSRLKAFSNQWSRPASVDGPKIQETSRIERQNGRKVYIRDQVWPMQQGLEMKTQLVLDAKTLETVSMQKEIVGLPKGASLGARPTFARWEFDGAKYSFTSRADGDPVTVAGELDQPMFNGGGLGLVLAALPLKEGYKARIPVAMDLGMSDPLTLYWVDLRVIGKEPFSRPKGKDVNAWIVEVDWVDPSSNEVTSKGGVDQPGGAYFVMTRPPKGFPHVPRYANDGGVIDLVLD